MDDSVEWWRTERVSFTAAYGDERIPAWLYLPKHARPPYQAVLYFPSGAAEFYDSSDRFPELRFSFLMRSGRAVLFPVYQGLLERRGQGPVGPNAQRDEVVQMNKDARRALDYLGSRPDIDSQRLGFYGASAGSNAGVRIAALDARLRAIVLVSAGLALEKLPPEVDDLNFAPRVKSPVLIVNGRNDFIFPLEVSQRPLYRFLGTPEKDKRLALLEGGHAQPNSKEMIRETLDWFDRYLGPVTPSN
jgi:dipeptidyl aminopeptidase/acylaminoacyl peptidase